MLSSREGDIFLLCILNVWFSHLPLDFFFGCSLFSGYGLQVADMDDLLSGRAGIKDFSNLSSLRSHGLGLW